MTSAAQSVLASDTRLDCLRAAEEAFASRLAACPGVRALPVPDHAARARDEGTLRRPVDWRNHLVTGPGLNRAHVEFFAIPGQIGVLHVSVFPALDRAAPIFGFDVISGLDKTTGLFLELSPTTPEALPAIADWGGAVRDAAAWLGAPRTLPDWSTAIFSPHAIAVRPEGARAVEAGIALALAALEMKLEASGSCDPEAMWAAQARYVAAQRQNPHTRRMLAGCVGPRIADAFISEVLFPSPETAAPPPSAARQQSSA